MNLNCIGTLKIKSALKELKAGDRVIAIVTQMDEEGFDDCSNHAECEAVCPKEISISHVVRMKREYFKAALMAKS